MANAEQYLEHAAWIRELAHRLVFDQSKVDDVVQQTWVELLQRPPRHQGNVRGWLASVVRNSARQSGRSDARRVAREQKVARRTDSVTDSSAHSLDPEALVEKARLERRVVDQVLELREPYRQSILMRYFEGLSAAEIARHLGEPAGTIRARIRRGLEQLRGQLDEGFGDRRTWSLALLPMASGAQALSETSAMSGLGKVVKPKLAVGALVLVAGLIWWLVAGLPSMTPAASPSGQSGSAAHGASDSLASHEVDKRAEQPGPVKMAPTPGPDEANLASEGKAASDDSAESESDRVLTAGVTRGGRVVDLDGAGVAGALVVWFNDAASADEFDDPYEENPDLDALYKQLMKLGEPAEAPPEARGLWDRRPAPALTDDDGLFELARRYEGEGEIRVLGSLIVQKYQFEDGDHIELDLIVSGTTSIRGHVVDGVGNGVRGAWIEVAVVDRTLPILADLDPRAARSHKKAWRVYSYEGGVFNQRQLPKDGWFELTVNAEGYRLHKQDLELPVDGDLRIVLEPLATTQQVTGRVVDLAGQGVEGAQVFVRESTALSDMNGDFSMTVSEVPKGTRLMAVKREYAIQKLQVDDWSQPVKIQLRGPALSISGRIDCPEDVALEEILVGLQDPTWPESEVDLPLEYNASGKLIPVKVDRLGVFRVDGLANRDYQLRVWHRSTLHLIVVDPIAAGTENVIIRFARDQLRPEVHGVLRTPAGDPLGGIPIRLEIVTERYSSGHNAVSKVVTTTDQHGAFTVQGIPRIDAALVVRGEYIETLRFALDGEGSPLDLTLNYSSRFIAVLDREEVDGVRILDGDGNELDLIGYGEDAVISGNELPVKDQRSLPCEVSDAARTIVFYQGEREVSRRTLELVLGDNGEVEF